MRMASTQNESLAADLTTAKLHCDIQWCGQISCTAPPGCIVTKHGLPVQRAAHQNYQVDRMLLLWPVNAGRATVAWVVCHIHHEDTKLIQRPATKRQKADIKKECPSRRYCAAVFPAQPQFRERDAIAFCVHRLCTYYCCRRVC